MNSPAPTAPSFYGARHNHEQCVRDALDRAARRCEARGARLTKLRRWVLELVWRSHKAVKAYDILAQLGAAHAAAKPPTVYRALDFLMAHGLVHRIDSLNAYVGCTLAEGPHSAQLFICESCLTVSELDEPALRAAVIDRAAAAGFVVNRQSIEAHGLCPRCR